MTDGEKIQKSLDVGNNTITFTVVAENGESTSYTVNITKAQAPVDDTDDDSSSSSSSPSYSTSKKPKESKKDEVKEIISEINTQSDEPVILEVDEIAELPADIFDSLKDSGSVLEIKGTGFTWTFDGNAEGSGEMNGDFKPGISFVEPEDVKRHIPGKQPIILKTDYHGELPFEARITIDVPDHFEDKNVILYFYNESTDKLEIVGMDKMKDNQVSFTLTHCSTYIVNDTPVFLEDCDTSKYAFGYDDGTFKPDQYINRAEAVSFLNNILETSGIQPTHSFVDSDMWAETSINNLYALGIVKGYEDNTFRPYDFITRAEMATIITKIFNLDSDVKNEFSDTVNHWANPYINAVTSANITIGYPDNTFRPDNPTTRAEALVMINKALNRKLSNDATNAFVDVDEAHWGYEHIVNVAE